MKSYADISAEVKEFIASTLGSSLKHLNDACAITDLTTDSIQLFELLLAFEQYYQLETTYEDVVQLNTVGDIVDYIAYNKYNLSPTKTSFIEII